MPETLTERLVALAAVVCAIALVLVALSFQSERETREIRARALPADTASTSPAPAPVESEPIESASVGEPASSATSPSTATLVVTAARGSCWVSVRADSATGRVLYDGIVDSGRTIRLRGSRLWVRLGSAANVDVAVNGKPVRQLPGGMVDLLATRAGVASAPSA
jgi:uncharacterized protein DUF4115